MSTAAVATTPPALKQKAPAGVFLLSVCIHLVLAAGAGVWIVARYIKPPEAKFEAPAKPPVKIPPQTRQHRINLAAHEGMAPKPTFNKRVISLRPMAFALPEAPKVNMDQMLTADPSAVANINANLNGLGGTGNGQGDGMGGSGGLGIGNGFNFMGIHAKGERIMLMFDVSASVLHKAENGGVPLTKIKEETLQLLAQLPINARFNIVQFVRNYKPFQKELIPATPANRDTAKQWVDTEWNESGQMAASGGGVIAPTPNGLLPILDFVFSLKPDIIFLISDASFQSGRGGETVNISSSEIDAKLKELEAAFPKPVPIHFIGFGVKPEDKAAWEKLVRPTGGRVRELVKYTGYTPKK